MERQERQIELEPELGHRVRDRVTGFEGIITGIATYLTGCEQACIAGESHDGKAGESMWVDTPRLTVLSPGVSGEKWVGVAVTSMPGGPASTEGPPSKS